MSSGGFYSVLGGRLMPLLIDGGGTAVFLPLERSWATRCFTFAVDG